MKNGFPFLLCFLAVSAFAQSLPNSDFESVTYDSLGSRYLPDSWDMDDFGCAASAATTHGGTYSLAVWNWYYYAEGFARNGSIPGFITDGDWIPGGTPLSVKPSQLTGFYLYDTTNTMHSAGPDSARVVVALKHWNAAASRPDTVALTELRLPTTGTPATWQAFTVDIQDLMPGTDPDSIVVTFVSSLNGFCSASSSGNCLYLHVDDLSLVSTGVDGRAIRTPLVLFPNPVKEQAHLQMEGLMPQDRVEVRDVMGKLVTTQNASLPIDAQNLRLVTGVYLVSVMRGAEVLSATRMVVE